MKTALACVLVLAPFLLQSCATAPREGAWGEPSGATGAPRWAREKNAKSPANAAARPGKPERGAVRVEPLHIVQTPTGREPWRAPSRAARRGAAQGEDALPSGADAASGGASEASLPPPVGERTLPDGAVAGGTLMEMTVSPVTPFIPTRSRSGAAQVSPAETEDERVVSGGAWPSTGVKLFSIRSFW